VASHGTFSSGMWVTAELPVSPVSLYISIHNNLGVTRDRLDFMPGCERGLFMRRLANGFCLLLLVLISVFSRSAAGGSQSDTAIPIDRNSIGGIVVNVAGAKPEAGVWVIAETKLQVPFRKIVVTDDQGRFLVPDLPEGSYELWVRGYGLKDSQRVKASRGEQVKIQVANAATPQEAARIYPASYWTSLVALPSKDEIGGKFEGMDHWEAEFRGGCNQCHQIGMVATRRYTDTELWDGIFQRNIGMNAAADRLGRPLIEKTLAEWGTRIQAGEVPPAPPRPVGIERNFVITQWDWGAPDSFIHDLVSTDKRNPMLYPYGKVYGADRTGGGRLWVLDPTENSVSMFQIQPRSLKNFNIKLDYYHDRETSGEWMASPHNPMLDEQGRVWMTEPIHGYLPEDYPKWAKSVIATEDNSPAEIDLAYQLLLTKRHAMQLGYFDTRTQKFVTVDTAYTTHHLQFDKNDLLWANNPGDVVALGMLDTKKIDPNNPEGTEADAQKAWMRIDMDTKKTVPATGYAVAVNPVDGTIWQTDPATGGPQNKLYMFDPKTRKFKDYPLALPGRLPHGIDFSTDRIAWFSAGSGHLGRFDPKSEKFTYWELPGPKYKGAGKETGSTEYPYFLWVDQFDTLGLGKNTVIVTGTTSDSMLIFDPKKETFLVVRVPYPIPFYTRGLDGRIDDANAGWKGRGIWATYSSYMPKFTETRIGSANHIQLRPSPLAN
jgi:hypothetical protein